MDRSVDRALDSETAARATERLLDNDTTKRVWDKVLESDEAQKLVERVADAPEVRAAIAKQGIGVVAGSAAWGPERGQADRHRGGAGGPRHPAPAPA